MTDITTPENVSPVTTQEPSVPVAPQQPLSHNSPLTKELHYFSWNDEVSILQQFLTDKGCYKGRISGFFGAKTRTGLSVYQKSVGLLETGILDDATRSLINQTIALDHGIKQSK